MHLPPLYVMSLSGFPFKTGLAAHAVMGCILSGFLFLYPILFNLKFFIRYLGEGLWSYKRWTINVTNKEFYDTLLAFW